MRNIVCFKLISGDEVVGELVQSETLGLSSNGLNTFVMAKPFIVLASQQGIGLIPVMVTAQPEDKITFNYASLATLPQRVVGDFEKHYLEKTSGLQLLS